MKKTGYLLSVLIIVAAMLLQSIGICADETPDSAPPVQIGIDEQTESEYLCQYTPVASDAEAVLYADQTRGHIALKNKQSGHIWYSVPNDFQLDKLTSGEKRMNVFSDVIVSYLTVTEEGAAKAVNTASSHSDCVREGTVTYKTVKNGIEFCYKFTSIDADVYVSYTLENGNLSASLELDKLRCGKDLKISAIRILPSFGAGNWSDNGYLFVPDGSGAVINFNNQVDTIDGYRGTVYGNEAAEEIKTKESDTQTVLMPVFGIKNQNHGLLGIVTSGDAMTTIVADNGDSAMGYNIVSAEANLRNVSKMTLYENDWANKSEVTRLSSTPVNLKKYTVRYIMLENEEAGYVGMAKAYRSYLTDDKGMKRKALKPTLYLNIYGAADFQKTFFGIPYTSLETLTTFDQARQMISELSQEGADSISVRFTGWNNSGILNRKLPKNLKPLGKLGGESGLKKLSQYCDKNGFELSLDIDFQRYRKSGNGYYKSKDSTKTAFGEVASQNEYLSSVYTVNTKFESFYLLKPSKLFKISDKLLKSIPGGINNISLSAMGSEIYSDLKDDGTFRGDALEIYDKILKNYESRKLNLSFQRACAYTFRYADSITDTPLFSSGYALFDNDVPFYQVVLHGWTDITAETLPYSLDERKIILKAAELGLNISYHGMYRDATVLSTTRYDKLYSTTFSLWKDRAVSNYKELEPLLDKVASAEIKNHRIVGDGITETVFDNGVAVYVNYNDMPASHNGVNIEPLGFTVLG